MEVTMTKLQDMRKKRGLRQAELARRLQVSRQCVCIAEKKGIRNADAAERYAQVLQCRPADLIPAGDLPDDHGFSRLCHRQRHHPLSPPMHGAPHVGAVVSSI